jgi:hypothetical protein
MEDEYITTKEAKEISKVTVKTLRLWDKEGKIRTIRTSSNIRRYNIKDIQNIINNSDPDETKEKICYCRVSSREQMDDLDRQKDFFRNKFPTHNLVTDVGSGINWKRKVLQPFWTKQCMEISQKLWLPTETVSLDSPLNFWSGFSNEMESNSWFLMKKKTIPQTKISQTISSPSYMFIPIEKLEKEHINIRTKRIRLYPTQTQQHQLKQWMGNRRFIYNRVLDKIKKGEEKINFFSLRNKYVTSKSISLEEKWQLDTPKDIRAGAIRDIVKNYKTVFSQLKNRQIKHFKMCFI